MDGSVFDIVGFTFSGNLIFAEKDKKLFYITRSTKTVACRVGLQRLRLYSSTAQL